MKTQFRRRDIRFLKPRLARRKRMLVVLNVRSILCFKVTMVSSFVTRPSFPCLTDKSFERVGNRANLSLRAQWVKPECAPVLFSPAQKRLS